MRKISPFDFCNSLGIKEEELFLETRKIIINGNFDHEVISDLDKEDIYKTVIDKIRNDSQLIGSPDRKNIWHKGWNENLELYSSNVDNLSSLIPKFIRPTDVVRLFGQYVKPQNSMFELSYFEVIRDHLFRTYFNDVSSVYEYGCGTGFNLVELAKIYPDKNLYGSDFVQSSVDLVNKVAKSRVLNINSFIFDMVHPDKSRAIEPNSGVYTFGSLEQISSQFEEFIEYLLHQKITRCVHMEPTIELYDQDILFDYLAAWFHSKRGYTTGLLPYLQRKEAEGSIRIIKTKRTGMGSIMMEGFSYIVWEPLRS